MRAWELRGAFGLENMVLTERPDPEPGPGQVVVRIRAASLNYRDALMVGGIYNPRQKLPLIPLSDGAGEVVAVGPGVTRVAAGDHVLTSFFQAWLRWPVPKDPKVLKQALGGPLDGALAELMLLPEDGVVKAPPASSGGALGWEALATLPCAGLTAYSALVSQGALEPGDWVVAQGTGGVSLFALQIAKAMGMRVVITSSSDEKLARAQALGADAGINYRAEPEWGKAVRALTGGIGADHVVEVGGAGTLAESLRAVRAGGQVSLIGVLSGPTADVSLLPILMQNVRLQGVLVGPRDDLERFATFAGEHRLTPVIDRTFDFDEAPRAFEHLASGQHFGKVCVRMP